MSNERLSPESLQRDKTRIMLVDDNPPNLQDLLETLQGRGYYLSVAKDGETALSIASVC